MKARIKPRVNLRVCLKNREGMQSVLEVGQKQWGSEENGKNDLT